MNIRERVKNKLGVEKLEDYIVDQFNLGKRDAEIFIEEAYSEWKINLEKIDDDEIIITSILGELISLKNFYFKAFYFEYHEIINGARNKFVQENIDISPEINEVENFSKFILDFYDFKQLDYISYLSNIKKVREKSREYNSSVYLGSNSDFIFNKLNNLFKIEEFEWNWENFEKGLVVVLNKNLENKRVAEIDKKHEVQLLNFTHKSDIKIAQNEIASLNREISILNQKNEFLIDYQDKYYYKNQVVINNTFFGDNLPFLFNIFNFLQRNNLLSYGWSYFYSCLIVGNKEMIPLMSSKKLNFIGRIFYHLKDYLILEYKDEAFKFIQSKFLINEVSISDNFRTNHMKTLFDKEEDPNLILIDDFFEESKKIYLKS